MIAPLLALNLACELQIQRLQASLRSAYQPMHAAMLAAQVQAIPMPARRSFRGLSPKQHRTKRLAAHAEKVRHAA